MKNQSTFDFAIKAVTAKESKQAKKKKNTFSLPDFMLGDNLSYLAKYGSAFFSN